MALINVGGGRMVLVGLKGVGSPSRSRYFHRGDYDALTGTGSDSKTPEGRRLVPMLVDYSVHSR
jgi:hypothetical protein